MAGWSLHNGTALALPMDNIDTDQLIPARFMSTPRTQGYGGFLLHDMRRDPAGELRPDFPLNSAEGITVLIAGRNFGCGSSREAAVYALVDAGIQAVIAPGFGDIFAGNAVNNGLLPARVSEDDGAALLAALGPLPAHVTLDLARLTLTLDGMVLPFALDPVWQTKLINGWDDIDLTRNSADAIAAYRGERRQTAPWVWSR